MTKTICTLAAVALSGAVSMFAQDAPAPNMMPPPPPPCAGKMPPPPPPCDELMSPEAQKQIMEKEKEIHAIRKAEHKKIKEKRDAFKKLVEEYKTSKDEAVKTKIIAELGSAFDAKMQKKQARLDEEKARKNEIVNKMFENIVNGKQPCKFKGPKGGKTGQCNSPMHLPPPPPPAD